LKIVGTAKKCPQPPRILLAPLPDTTQTGPSCRVWCGGVRSVQRRSVSGGAGTAGATAGRTPTQNALVGRSGQLNSHRLARHREHGLLVCGGGVNWALLCSAKSVKHWSGICLSVCLVVNVCLSDPLIRHDTTCWRLKNLVNDIRDHTGLYRYNRDSVGAVLAKPHYYFSS